MCLGARVNKLGLICCLQECRGTYEAQNHHPVRSANNLLSKLKRAKLKHHPYRETPAETPASAKIKALQALGKAWTNSAKKIKTRFQNRFSSCKVCKVNWWSMTSCTLSEQSQHSWTKNLLFGVKAIPLVTDHAGQQQRCTDRKRPGQVYLSWKEWLRNEISIKTDGNIRKRAHIGFSNSKPQTTKKSFSSAFQQKPVEQKGCTSSWSVDSFCSSVPFGVINPAIKNTLANVSSCTFNTSMERLVQRNWPTSLYRKMMNPGLVTVRPWKKGTVTL